MLYCDFPNFYMKLYSGIIVLKLSMRPCSIIPFKKSVFSIVWGGVSGSSLNFCLISYPASIMCSKGIVQRTPRQVS